MRKENRGLQQRRAVREWSGGPRHYSVCIGPRVPGARFSASGEPESRNDDRALTGTLVGPVFRMYFESVVPRSDHAKAETPVHMRGGRLGLAISNLGSLAIFQPSLVHTRGIWAYSSEGKEVLWHMGCIWCWGRGIANRHG